MRLFDPAALNVVENDADTQVINTIVETELLVGAETIPGGSLPSFNRAEISIFGNVGNASVANHVLTFRFKLNATTEITTTSTMAAGAGTHGWEARFFICARFVAGGVDGIVEVTMRDALVTSTGTSNLLFETFADGAINTANAITPHITAQWDAADANLQLTALHYQHVIYQA